MKKEKKNKSINLHKKEKNNLSDSTPKEMLNLLRSLAFFLFFNGT